MNYLTSNNISSINNSSFFTIDRPNKLSYSGPSSVHLTTPVLRLYKHKYTGIYSLILIKNNRLYNVVMYGPTHDLCNIVVTNVCSNSVCCGVIRCVGEINLRALCLHLLEYNKANSKVNSRVNSRLNK